jgi:hypothetical protein
VIFRGAAALVLLWWAVQIAFGRYKAPAPNFTMQAANALRARKAEHEQVEKYYAKSKLWGLLNDPNLGRDKIRPIVVLLWILIIAALYGAVGLVISLATR